MTGIGPNENSEGIILPRVIGNSWETGFFTYLRSDSVISAWFLLRKRPKTLLRLPWLEPEVQTQ